MTNHCAFVCVWACAGASAISLSDLRACLSLLSSTLPLVTAEWAREGVTAAERKRFLFSTVIYLSVGPYIASLTLRGDKTLERSLLSIYFLTVKTYIQSHSYSAGMKYAGTRLHVAAARYRGLTQVDWWLLRGYCYGLLSYRCAAEWLVWVIMDMLVLLVRS